MCCSLGVLHFLNTFRWPILPSYDAQWLPINFLFFWSYFLFYLCYYPHNDLHTLFQASESILPLLIISIQLLLKWLHFIIRVQDRFLQDCKCTGRQWWSWWRQIQFKVLSFRIRPLRYQQTLILFLSLFNSLAFLVFLYLFSSIFVVFIWSRPFECGNAFLTLIQSLGQFFKPETEFL